MNITNRRARFDYNLIDKYEAGIMLIGAEVKSLQMGQGSLNESYCDFRNGELYLLNAHINPYKPCRDNAEPTRPRKLLLNKKELSSLIGKIGVSGKSTGLTIVPTRYYFNHKKIKLEIWLAKGKTDYDKRQDQADKSWKKDQARIMKGERYD